MSGCTPIFEALAPEDGWAHVGPSGAGHFVKMVHNGIEYGLMQAYAEGFELMHQSEFELDLSEIAGIWRYGSVVRSWLLELLHEAFEEHGDGLDDIAPYVEDSGEGRWTINEAIDSANVPLPAITSALFARFASRREIDFSAKVQAALRNQFGGHAVQGGRRRRRRRPTRGEQRRREPAPRGPAAPAQPDPCALVIFGASGDLTRRKLFPALYSLAVRRLLPEHFGVVGVARTEQTTKQWVAAMKKAVVEYGARRVRRAASGTSSPPACATSRPTSPTTSGEDRVRRDAARARRGARDGRQPRLLPRRPAGGVRDDRERARRAARAPRAGRG